MNGEIGLNAERKSDTFSNLVYREAEDEIRFNHEGTKSRSSDALKS